MPFRLYAEFLKQRLPTAIVPAGHEVTSGVTSVLLEESCFLPLFHVGTVPLLTGTTRGGGGWSAALPLGAVAKRVGP